MKSARIPPRRRRILLLSGDSYASAKRIATGVVRFVAARPDLELLVVSFISKVQTITN